MNLSKKTQFIKKPIIFLLLICGISTVNAQERTQSLKFNLTGIPIQLYSFQYEVRMGKKWSFNNTFFYRQKDRIPFDKTLDKWAKKGTIGFASIKFEYIFVDQSKLGGYGYSPEFRKYLGRSKNPFFIGFFGQVQNTDMLIPIQIAVTKSEITVEVVAPIDVHFGVLSSGILLGKQFNFNNRLGLDVVIFGPQVGRVFNFSGNYSSNLIELLNQEEENQVKEDTKKRFGITDKYFTLNIEKNSARINTKRAVPFVAFRALGLNLFYRF